MHRDPRGIPLTTDNADAADKFEHALTAFCAQRGDFGAVLAEVLSLDPDMVVTNCLAGFAQLFAARRPMVVQAGYHLARAQTALALRGGTRREATLISSLAAWHDQGDMWRAIGLLDDAHRDDPRDLLLLRLAYSVRFMLGDAHGMRDSLETALPAWSSEVRGYPFVLGCHAFALGETGEFARAERVGQMGVAMEPQDLWGAHAVAHAMGALKRPREGIAWITWLEPHMTGGASFSRHLHWHRALCHLRLGELETALALYDQRIRNEASGDVRDILNAASLLWRLEAAGVPAGRRWEELADIAGARIGEHCWVFADLHYVLCLASAGRTSEVSAMLGSIAARAVEPADTQAGVHRQVGLTTARAVAAAAQGSSGVAVELFAAARPDIHRVGGSIAQRDLLRQMHSRADQDLVDTRDQRTMR